MTSLGSFFLKIKTKRVTFQLHLSWPRMMLDKVAGRCYDSDVDVHRDLLADRLVSGGLSKDLVSSFVRKASEPCVQRRACLFPTMWLPLPYHPVWCNSLAKAIRKFSRDWNFTTPLGMATQKWATTLVRPSWSNHLPSLERRLEVCGRRQG